MALHLHVWVRSPAPGIYDGIALVQLVGVTARALQFTIWGDDLRQRRYELRRQQHFQLRGSTAGAWPRLEQLGGPTAARLIQVVLAYLDRAVDRLRTGGSDARPFYAEYLVTCVSVDAPLLDRLFGPRPVPQPRDG